MPTLQFISQREGEKKLTQALPLKNKGITF